MFSMVSPRRCESLAIVVRSFRPQNKTQKALRLPITETGAVIYFIGTFSQALTQYLAGVLIAVWAGAKIAERSQQ